MSAPLTLTRLTGFDRNKSLSFSAARVVLGTDVGADLRFDSTWDRAVSPRHAELVWEGSEWTLVDAGSRDGCWINGEKVQRAAVAPGTVIELGKKGPQIRVDYEPSAAPAPAPTMAATAPVAPITPAAPAAAAPAQRASGFPWGALIAALVVLGGGGWAVWWFALCGGCSPAERLAHVAEDKADAVGVLAFVDSSSANQELKGNGTTFAVAPRVFVANAAIVWSAAEMMKQGIDCYIVVKGEELQRLRVTGTRLHPRGENPQLSFEGETPKVFPYDVGLILTEADAPDWFEVAPDEALFALEIGQATGFLGFSQDTSMSNPEPKSGAGQIVGLTDFWLKPVDPKQQFLIQHNLMVPTGASGSPLFDVKGRLLGLLTIPLGSEEAAGGGFAPNSAVFGQRIDLLKEVWSEYPRD